MKKLLFLYILALPLYGQTFTNYFQFPIWGLRDTVASGSTSDTTIPSYTRKNDLNLISTRADVFLHRWFDKTNDSLRNIKYMRFTNGLRWDLSNNKAWRITSLATGGANTNVLYNFLSGGQLTIDSRDSGFVGSHSSRIFNNTGLKTLTQFGASGAGYFFVSARAPLDTSSAFNSAIFVYRDTTVHFQPIEFANPSTQAKIYFSQTQHSLIRNNGTELNPVMLWDVRDSVASMQVSSASLRALSFGNTAAYVQSGVSTAGYAFVSARPPGDSTSSFNLASAQYRDSLQLNGSLRLSSLSSLPTTRGHIYRENDTLKWNYGSSSVARLAFEAPTTGQALTYDGRVWAPGVPSATTAPRMWPITYPSSYTIPDSSIPLVLNISFTGILDSVYVLRTGGTSSSVMVVKDSLGTRRDILSAQISSSTSRTANFVNQYNGLQPGFTIYAFARAASGSQYLTIQVVAHQTQ